MRENLSRTERTISMIAGLGLAAAGATPRPNRLLSAAALGAGAFLAWRGYVGACPLKAALMQARQGRARLPAA